MENRAITTTSKVGKYTFHVTLVNFNKEKHQDMFNSHLAQLLLKNHQEKAG